MADFSEVIIPETFAEAIEPALEGAQALVGTDAVAMDTTLQCARKDAGSLVSVPYFEQFPRAQRLGARQALVPNNVGQDQEKSPIQRVGIALTVGDLEVLAALNDPYTYGAKKAMESIMWEVDQICVEEATSLILPATVGGVAETDWPLIYDAYGAPIGPITINPDVITRARFLFGDEQREGEFAGWMMHSKTAMDLCLLKDAGGRSIYQDGQNGALPQLMGRPIVMSDKTTKDATLDPVKYYSALLKKKSLAVWLKTQPEVYYGVDPLTGDQILSIFVYVVVHRYRIMMSRSKGGVVIIKHK